MLKQKRNSLTCFQILTAAYAYFEHYRQICEGSEDKIYDIAILLAKK